MRMKLLLLSLVALRPAAALLSFEALAFRTNIIALWTVWSLVTRFASSVPLPPQLLINKETRECTIEYFGDECDHCFIHYGWESIGYAYYDKVKCPDGYSMVETGPAPTYCRKNRDPICCSDSFHGVGNCRDLVFNEDLEKCSISLCEDSELPRGWTRDLPDDSYGKCPYDGSSIGSSYIEPEDFGCEDPCKDLLACSECIDSGCVWSLANGICRPVTYPYRSYLSSPPPNTSADELCEEFTKVERDNTECEAKTSCKDCLATALPSDNSKNCRWVNTCSSDEFGANCEQCFASSCIYACREISNCSDGNLCSAESCTDCLDQGCFWIVDRRRI